MWFRSNQVDLNQIFTDSRVLVVTGEAALEHLTYNDIYMHRQSMLHLAAEYSHECLELLLFGPCSKICHHITESDYFNLTPLHLAAVNTTPDCASKILDSVENAQDLLEIVDREGNTPLHLVCQKGKQGTSFNF